jgi:hypothetical protein
MDVVLEYNPFKYNSFPTYAGLQTFRLTTQVQRDLANARRAGTIGQLPPMLTFQSVVDATVSTPAVIHDLYDRLEANGSELVLFDINRVAGLDEFLRPVDAKLVADYYGRQPTAYRRTLLTNASTETVAVIERTVGAGATNVSERGLDTQWPAGLFSLSHVALPFPLDDPVYGTEAPVRPDGPIALGRLSPRGERAVLTVAMETLMRVSSNPFYPYLQDRVLRWVDGGPGAAGAPVAPAAPAGAPAAGGVRPEQPGVAGSGPKS